MNLCSIPLPLGRLTASFILKGMPVGLDPSAILSLCRMSQTLESHTQPSAAGPHLALAQGMRACMLSQGGDSWVFALKEMGLYYIKNPPQKPSGVTLCFSPNNSFHGEWTGSSPRIPRETAWFPIPSQHAGDWSGCNQG